MYTVGQFCESYPPLMDGVANVLLNYVHHLRQMDVDARAIVSSVDAPVSGISPLPEEAHVLRAKLHPMPGMKPYGVVTFSRPFRRNLAEIPFDVVHGHDPAFFGSLALKEARRREIPFVITFHTQIKGDIKGMVRSEVLTKQLLKQVMTIYDKADDVWVPSEAALDVIRSYGYTGPATIMENCTDFTPPDETTYQALRAEGRKRHMKDTARPLLIYLGQQSKKKNIRFFLESLATLNRQGQPFEMLMVGEGPDKAEFEQFTRQNGLQDRVTFLGRINDREHVKMLLASSDLMVFPSLYDVASIAIREAAAYRVPVIGIEGSCTSSIIVPERNGYLAPHDLEAFTRLLKHALDNPEERLAMGYDAQKTIFKSWADIAEVVNDRYVYLINKNRKARGLSPLAGS